jgi:flagellar biosynthetic protein FliR
MDTLALFQEDSVVTFVLVFVRISLLFAFVPFFNNASIPTSVKAGLSFYLAFMFYPLIPAPELPNSWVAIFTAVLSEMAFSAVVGLVLSIALYMLMYAGEQISLMMGFSMATVFDPQVQISMPVLSKFLSTLALMIILATDFHHSMLKFFHASITAIPLGGFVIEKNVFDYLVISFENLFIMGLSLSFPILALSMLSDIMFGMLMKTMPQFNLLVIGFPIKITIGFIVFIATVSTMMFIFKKELFESYQALEMLF